MSSEFGKKRMFQLHGFLEKSSTYVICKNDTNQTHAGDSPVPYRAAVEGCVLNPFSSTTYIQAIKDTYLVGVTEIGNIKLKLVGILEEPVCVDGIVRVVVSYPGGLVISSSLITKDDAWTFGSHLFIVESGINDIGYARDDAVARLNMLKPYFPQKK